MPIIDRAKAWYWFLTDGQYRQHTLAHRTRMRAKRSAHIYASPIIRQQSGGQVLSGPFQGMKYIEPSGDANFDQKLLGVYESELNDVIEEICRRQYSTVIDIGAAEGYYVCGLARRLPNTRVVAYELAAGHRASLHSMAVLNGLRSRIEILEECTLDTLRAKLDGVSGSCVMICDIEGGEHQLMDPAAVPALQGVDILIEVHRNIVIDGQEVPCPGLLQILSERFEKTHTITVIESQPRSVDDWPSEVKVSPAVALAVMDEMRGGPMPWLWLQTTSRQP